ncbi:uncharacterized protein LOC121808941 [Salvia splendens]|uniref:uncharacterized protein LOC121808941 n=1 Tax=Salvia splendens TaxID=180675 RepID=UPI001C28085D|nr:uncharacterized protein LOC121808941 [Salvia splendens]
MHRYLFVHIVQTLSACYLYIQQQSDASGRPGLSPLQKYIAAIRQLAYGGPSDMFDKYLHIGDTTGRECPKEFCKGIIKTFSSTYLRKSTHADSKYLLDLHGRVHGFPRKLCSVDCLHWEWKQCLTAWKGQFTAEFKGKYPKMILEAVSNRDCGFSMRNST